MERSQCQRCLLPAQSIDGHNDPFACIEQLRKRLLASSVAYQLIWDEYYTNERKEKERERIRTGDRE